jgi:SMODS-associating 4TM effector domain
MAHAVWLPDASSVTPTSVQERQNKPAALRAARAFRRRYVLAKRWHMLRLGVGVLLGTAGVVLASLDRSTGDYLAAAAAGWIVLSRTILLRQETHAQDDGALAQEVFDTNVLYLPWNATTAGPKPAPEDLRNWGEHQPEDEMRDWYADVRPARHPVDALICQRASVTWARQDHAAYAQILRVATGIILVGTVVLGVALGLSLGDYLLRLGLPVLPAILDVLDIANGNEILGRSRARLAHEADHLYAEARKTGTAPSIQDCRSLQDEIYTMRRIMGVPSWFYRLTRHRRQRNMIEVTQEQVSHLPASLR